MVPFSKRTSAPLPSAGVGSRHAHVAKAKVFRSVPRLRYENRTRCDTNSYSTHTQCVGSVQDAETGKQGPQLNGMKTLTLYSCVRLR